MLISGVKRTCRGPCAASARRLGGSFMNLQQARFELHDGLIAGHALQVDKPPAHLRTAIAFDEITRITFCVNGDDSFVAIALTETAEGQAVVHMHGG